MTHRAWFFWFLAWLLFAFLQAPGLTVADTKHDLTANPWGFLGQALSPWTDVFPLGQLQNQAYGYLFPQGLFFALFSWAPDWITQRLWWALLLCLAFSGMVKVLECAGIGSRGSRVLAGVLYALSPRILTTLGAISSEAWVVAIAPWVLVPVICMAESRRPAYIRLMALSSALAILCLGAVNAVATVVVVIPALVWWISSVTRKTSRKAALRFGAWWVPASIFAAFWWVGPLLVLGAYSPPFTDFIESSKLTTRWLNVLEVLRGTTSWTPFLSTERVGGYALATQPVFIVSTLLVALIGLWGLAQRTMPQARRWLTILAIGALAMILAFEPFSPVAGTYRNFLDGAGAALRNLHKFDPVVRLALMAGFSHALRNIQWPGTSGSRWRLWFNPEKNPTVVRAIATTLLVVLATAPGWSGRIAPEDGFTRVPSYWQEAADWLNDNADGVNQADHQVARTMILPKARFARQTWGNTRDEPAQPLLDVPWVVRDSVPLVQPEAIRGLDGVQRELESGAAIPTLAATLWNQGVGQLLVRTDLTKSSDTPGSKGIVRTIETSGGFKEVASFGDGQGGDGKSPAIRIFHVQPPQFGDFSQAMGTAGDLRIVDRDQVETVAAGPESMSRLDQADAALGRTGAARTRLLAGEDNPDGNATSAQDLQTITDTPAVRDHNYGNVTNADSDIRSKDDRHQIFNPVTDYPVRGADTLTQVEGHGAVIASSSAADPTGFGGATTISGLNAAVDGEKETAWRPSQGNTSGEWLELHTPDSHRSFYLTFTTQGSPARVQVSSLKRDAESNPYSNKETQEEIQTSTTVTTSPKNPTKVALPIAEANAVRITILTAFGDFGISELKLVDGRTGEDYTPTRTITVPEFGMATQAEGRTVNRWVFGQEIAEGVMKRTFTLPERSGGMGVAPNGSTALLVQADSCTTDTPDTADSAITIDGEDHTCGQVVELTPGQHTVSSTHRWVSLSVAEPLYAQAVMNAGVALPVLTTTSGGDSTLDGDEFDIPASAKDRIIFTPSDTNTARKGTLHAADGTSLELKPITVNGWQQGWIIPAGASGTFSVNFAATTIYQGWLAVGLLLALIVVTVWLFMIIRHCGLLSEERRHRDAKLSTPSQPPAAESAENTTPAPKPSLFRRRTPRTYLGGVFWGTSALATIVAARGNWGTPSYAGDSWWVNGCLSIALITVYLAHSRFFRR
ncbi:alpha-(1-_3)-arabinofuranosyltransferase [Corynebacterium anserum]|uniref:DUF3367 domain-containing protein n=1 Tax=Corynebacterium anserum TaxID=2684406 RepID=A0A7G7YLQ1_9CORY|nr:alpha-(1->3)-arabinofuranosyltransferase [Corynebacterium anserum]QNH95421.1 DUF3367 domain-containing protein [Corynebacterium anserum]